MRDELRLASEIARMVAARYGGKVSMFARIIEAATNTGAALLAQGKSAEEVIASIEKIARHKADEIDVHVDEMLRKLPGRESER